MILQRRIYKDASMAGFKERSLLTSSCFRERGHSKYSVITGHFFKGNVAVPFLLVRLLLTAFEHEVVGVRLGLGIPNQGDMVIPGWVFLGISVIDGMDMQRRRFWLSRQLTEALS